MDALEIPHKRGRTFGYRISDGSGRLAYLPDHNPISLGTGPDGAGVYHDAPITLSKDADLLVHDSQHPAAELPRLGFLGHSAVEYAVAVAQRQRPATRAIPPRPVAYRCRNRRPGGTARGGARPRLSGPRRRGSRPAMTCEPREGPQHAQAPHHHCGPPKLSRYEVAGVERRRSASWRAVRAETTFPLRSKSLAACSLRAAASARAPDSSRTSAKSSRP